MTEKRLPPRKAGSPLSLRHLVPEGWHDERPAFAGDPFFDWESSPEPPRRTRELRMASPPKAERIQKA